MHFNFFIVSLSHLLNYKDTTCFNNIIIIIWFHKKRHLLAKTSKVHSTTLRLVLDSLFLPNEYYEAHELDLYEYQKFH